MKKHMLFVVCQLSLLSFASPDARDVTCEKYPDADAVTVDEAERVKYNPDGTYEQTDECWTKILTEKGRRSESSLSLDYSKRYGEAGIDYVGAIDAEGNEREIDVTATTKDSTDNSSMSSNIYDPLDRKIVCTIPGLKVGETLHVKTHRRTTKARCEGKWADISVMEWKSPIVRSTYEVTAPAERPLKKIAIRHPLGNVSTNLVRRADGSLVYTFTVTNSAQAFPEPDMPPLYTQLQNVRVSTASDWPEISRWYWDLCAPHLAKTNADMVAMVEKLKAASGGAASPSADPGESKLLRGIFKFVSQEVRYMGLTMEDTSPGYAPHDVDVTFDNRYGVCRDKAGLLVAMLRLAGFKAFPVLIHVGAKLDPEVPQPFFNHAIVAVETGLGCLESMGGVEGLECSSNLCQTAKRQTFQTSQAYILMDPTNENTADLYPSYLCNNSYLVARPEGEDLRTSPVIAPAENAVVVTSRGNLKKDGSVVLLSTVDFKGINDMAYRHALVRRKPEDRVKLFEKIVKGVAPGAELVNCGIEPKDMRDTSVPVRVDLAVRFPEMLLGGVTRSELTVPFLGKAFGMVNFLLTGSTSLEKRRFPLVLDTTAQVRETVDVDLSDAATGELLEKPADERIGMDGYEYVRTMTVTNGRCRAERSLTIGAVEFDPDAYARLREEIKRVEAAGRKRPVFAEDGLKDADVRWILDETETTVVSDTAWTTTNTVVKEVLTYEGKRHSAELKFSFNPAVERIGILSAVVSNRDGRVSCVSDREMNLMDCGWAAAAPRYPAGKTLVVNLPSVEIGSVISYQYVRAVTNAPASFYATYAFDSHEPLDRRVVRVNGWRREVKSPRRLPNEPSQPAASLWRDQVIVSSNDFAKAADTLRAAVDVAPAELPGLPDVRSIRSIRDWMATNVKIAGPGLYELPVARQLTDPETVLSERYATRLDYVRTLCALLRGAGFEADVVFAAKDADDPAEVRRRIMFEKPNVRAFDVALCRVRVREGGFLWFGGETKEIYLGTENQYAPIGPTAYEGCDCFDPAEGTFGLVTVPEASFGVREEERSEYVVRENGAVDLTVEDFTWGAGVGGFRKTYAEILPEDRSRRYQAILGGIAQAASATSELETDIESYPARRKFACFIPDFATVQGDALTIQVPPLVASMPSLVGTARQTPFAVGSADCEAETVTIRFPEGYTEIECLPKSFVLANPLDPSQVWLESTVSSEVKDGVLTVVLSRKVHKRPSAWYQPAHYELFKDWSRIANARHGRTVTVRRPLDRNAAF